MHNTLVNRISTVVVTQESQNESDNDQIPSKRLKLTTNSQNIALIGSYNQLIEKLSSISINSSLTESINEILEFSNNFDKKNSDSKTYDENLEEILKFLLDQYARFANSNKPVSNQLKLKSLDVVNDEISVQILLLKCILKLINPNVLSTYSNDFLNALSRTRNNKIVYELLRIIDKLISRYHNDNFKNSLLPFIKKFLKHNDHRLREICLRILSFHYIDHEMCNNNKIFQILLSHSEDQDARVRVASLNLLILLHQRGYKADVKYYETLKHRLTDDFDQVRLLAIEIIWLLATTYPEHMIDVGTGLEVEELRFIDEAFAKICNMINDLSLEVKVQAAKVLGKMNCVSSRFLMQTLDKKLMKDLRVRSTTQQKTLFSSEWSVTSAIPASDSQIQEEESISLISTGACGAFIHGLEDEYLEVRHECVNSLWKLAVNCPEFAAKSIDYLVDMFNDEIEAVRLSAIQSLSKIAHYVLLTDDQIEIVLPVIEDGSFEVREALRDLLSNCKLATKSALKRCIHALFNNLKKYQTDRPSIWKCFQNLGRNHAKFVSALISYVLNMHPFLDMPEQDMDDPQYISCLILIFNGAKVDPTIVSLLPKYVVNHYFYLKLKIPDCVPTIQYFDDDLSRNDILEDDRKSDKASELYKNILKNLEQAEHLAEDDTRLKLYNDNSNNLDHLARIEPDFLPSCEIMSTFIKCLLVIRQHLIEPNLVKLEEALLNSKKLLKLYEGYSDEEKMHLYELNNFLRILYLKHLQFIKKATSYNGVFNMHAASVDQATLFRRDFVKERRNYIEYLLKYKSYLKASLPHAFFSFDLFEKNPVSIMDVINASTNDELPVRLLLLQSPRHLRKMSLNILEPVENQETPVKYTPGLLNSIRIKALLFNFKRFDRLFIQIKYSDYEIQYIPIDLNKIKLLSNDKFYLDMNVLLSHSSWTEFSYIKLCLAMFINDDDIEANSEKRCMQADADRYTEENSVGNRKEIQMDYYVPKSRENFIELTKTVKVFFEPNAKKTHF